ncbi:hypothetical protein T265_15281, partial [Opisthorchis viverrini]
MLGYGIAKAAVHQLTKSLAAEGSGLPAGVHVTAILPFCSLYAFSLIALSLILGMLGYGIAKAAVHQLTKSLAAEGSGLPAGVHVTAILPMQCDQPICQSPSQRSVSKPSPRKINQDNLLLTRKNRIHVSSFTIRTVSNLATGISCWNLASSLSLSMYIMSPKRADKTPLLSCTSSRLG